MRSSYEDIKKLDFVTIRFPSFGIKQQLRLSHP